MTFKITDIKAIGRDVATKLNGLDIHTTEDLNKASRDPKTVQTLAEKTGLDQTAMDRFIRISQLTRVEGVNPQFAELLYWSGVDSVEKLREQKPEPLLRKLTEVNTTRKLTAVMPQVSDIMKWTSSARPMEPATVRN